MTDQEQEIVARAIGAHLAQEVGGCFNPGDDPQGECADGNCYCAHKTKALAQTAIKALDSHRANDAGEVEEALSLHADDDCDGKFVPTHICNMAANLISSLRAAIAEKDEVLNRIASKNNLSGIPDDMVESAARNALYECEMIARSTISDSTPHPDQKDRTA